MSAHTPPNLFSALSGNVFGPLASPNRAHYWLLLCRLFEEFFGPDAPLPPSMGLPRREITAAIERYLLSDDPWEAEDGDTLDTPLSLRATGIYERFRNSGWLRQERVGAREMVTMAPLVAQLLSTLMEFAEHGPTFVSARLRTVELQLQEVIDGKASGDALDEAADQARRLLVSLASMSLQVRDLMPQLTQAETTAQFARQWFERYVSDFFIGDYADLHRADHPLARRSSILGMAKELEMGPAREKLIAWYHTQLGDQDRGTQRFARSLRRLRELERIDEYLERLDDDIRQANRRALAFLDYRLRAPDKLEALLHRACRGALAAEESALRLPVAPGALMDESRLRTPRQKPTPIARSANSSQAPSPEQIARLSLLRKMKRARLVTAEDMANFVGRHLSDGNDVLSDALVITSIADLRAYQTLLTLAQRSHRLGGLRRDDPLGRLVRGFQVELLENQTTDSHWLHSPRFVIRRLTQNKKSAAVGSS